MQSNVMQFVQTRDEIREAMAPLLDSLPPRFACSQPSSAGYACSQPSSAVVSLHTLSPRSGFARSQPSSAVVSLRTLPPRSGFTRSQPSSAVVSLRTLAPRSGFARSQRSSAVVSLRTLPPRSREPRLHARNVHCLRGLARKRTCNLSRQQRFHSSCASVFRLRVPAAFSFQAVRSELDSVSAL